jgi:hypothetical protein
LDEIIVFFDSYFALILFLVFGFWVAQADLVVQVMTLAMPQDIHPLKSDARSMGWKTDYSIAARESSRDAQGICWAMNELKSATTPTLTPIPIDANPPKSDDAFCELAPRGTAPRGIAPRGPVLSRFTARIGRRLRTRNTIGS